LLSLFVFPACTRVLERFAETPPRHEANEHLERAQRLFERGEHDAAFRENERALSLAGPHYPADKALFNMGLISAHSQNLEKDYRKAQLIFQRVIREFPDSPFVEQSRAWVYVLSEHQKMSQEREALKREREVLLQEKTALNREKEKLSQSIEQSRKVDVEIEKKRRRQRSQ
jgi:tetratricopeptide (TPR) repeat protein